jgi:uncharacterized LabA/DUF88 family protein
MVVNFLFNKIIKDYLNLIKKKKKKKNTFKIYLVTIFSYVEKRPKDRQRIWVSLEKCMANKLHCHFVITLHAKRCNDVKTKDNDSTH